MSALPENKLRLVTIKEACAYGRMGKSKLYELIQDEKIIARKNGHDTLIDLNSIDAYQATMPRFFPRRKRRPS